VNEQREDKRVMAAQVIGSVGVRHAEMQSAEARLRLGNRVWMIAGGPTWIRNDDPEENEPTSNNNPTKCHSRDDHHEQTLCMFLHVGTWQFDTHRKETSHKDEPQYFKCNFVLITTPGPGIKYIDAVRTNENTERSSKNDFIDVKLVACSAIRCTMKVRLDSDSPFP